MTVVGDIAASLGELQSRIAGLSSGSGAAPAALGGDFSSVLSSLLAPSGDATVDGTAGPVSGDAVVTDASRYLGVAYRWGGTDPATGLDCSGLVQRVYADLGVALPRVAADQARTGTAVPDLAHAQPGDLVAFGSPVDHIGIYAGNGTMIVAPHTGKTVEVEPITGTPTAIRRIVPGAGDEGWSPAAAVGGSGSGVFGATPSALGVSAAASSGVVLSGVPSPAGTPTGPAAGPYAGLFNAAGERYGVDPRLLSAVARAESGYQPAAVSGAGAEGLMQLMPSTAASLGVDPLDPAQAVDGAARLLAGHLQRFGNVADALAAYNAGGTAVARYGGMPPYPETEAYVRRVLDYLSQEGA